MLGRVKLVVLALAAVLAPTAARAADEWQAMPLGKVALGGEYGRRLEAMVTNNLLKLDREQFLTGFRTKDVELGYIALGKLLDTLVATAKQTGRADVRQLKEALIAEVLKHQLPDGYLGRLRPESRPWQVWDEHEVAYIILALVNDWEEFGEAASLSGARKAADWVLATWSQLPSDWGVAYVNVPMYTIGQCRALLKLYRATGDRRYLDFVLKERGLAALDTPIFQGRAKLMWGHEYTYLEHCLAQHELWRLAGGDREQLLRQTHRAFRFLLDENGATVTGASGIAECWTDSQDGDGDVGETCATVYQLFTADSLVRLGGENTARLGDFMERTVWNAYFGAQAPDASRIRYYTPLLGERRYYQGGDVYCCPNNFRRLLPRLAQMALYTNATGFLANLYAPLVTTGRIDGVAVAVREVTDYPRGERIGFEFTPAAPVEFALTLRIPAWCEAAKVAVNGQPLAARPEAGRLYAVRRRWCAGDRLELTLPMRFRAVEGRARQSGRVAILRGPLVYAFDPARAARTSPHDRPWEAELFACHPFHIQAVIMADLAKLRLVEDDSVRPGGTAVELPVSIDAFSVDIEPEWAAHVRLTEYADPAATITYFRVPDIRRDAEPDELFRGRPAGAAQ